MARIRTTRWPEPNPGRTYKGRLRPRSAELHEAWGEFLGRLQWEWSVTLTFDPKRVSRVSRELASREAFRWCGLLGWIARRPVGWVYALERGRSGHWHAHVLVIGMGDIRLTTPGAMWRERNGFVAQRRVTEGMQVTMYTTKQGYRTGDIVIADTLKQYRDCTHETAMVNLYPADMMRVTPTQSRPPENGAR